MENKFDKELLLSQLYKAQDSIRTNKDAELFCTILFDLTATTLAVLLESVLEPERIGYLARIISAFKDDIKTKQAEYSNYKKGAFN